MIHLPASVRVYLCRSPCDMRRSFDRLHALVRDHLRLDALPSARARLTREVSLYQLLQILSITPFEKTPILQALDPFGAQDDSLDNSNQLELF